ncbi:hypothetical protein OF83DRAFT_425640 [Amylostereum chailletii]|nr:hypothetical protein OF83DRAFT_425640 [Amylostereum chailletii]
MCARHLISMPRTYSKVRAILLLLDHLPHCLPSCKNVYYIFTQLLNERHGPYPLNDVDVSPTRSGMSIPARISFAVPANPVVAEPSHPMLVDPAPATVVFPSVCSKDLHFSIIRQWQTETDPQKRVYKTCTSCGQNKFDSELEVSVHATKVTLSLLRDDDIPHVLWPVSYDFELYDRAILRPKGMSDHRVLGNLLFCKQCFHAAYMSNSFLICLY